MKKFFRGVAGAGVATVLGLAGVLVAAPAHATYNGSGYVDTSTRGTPTNDWTGEGYVNRNFRSNSAAAGLWQAFLFSRGYLSSWSDVDCFFGPATESATAQFQRDRGLTADGKVGPNTFGAADNYLREATNDGAYDKVLSGSGSRLVSFLRTTSGSTIVYAAQTNSTEGAWLYASYSDRGGQGC